MSKISRHLRHIVGTQIVMWGLEMLPRSHALKILVITFSAYLEATAEEPSHGDKNASQDVR